LTDAPGAIFEVEEIFTEREDLLVLSLGFNSSDDPLDVLHIVSGRQCGGREPPLVEDLLYMERTDQALACDGRDILRVSAHSGCIELVLTMAGAEALGLPERTIFRFTRHLGLLAPAHEMLAAMRAAGQRQIIIEAGPIDM
jgi:hypothetical protein